MFCCKTQSNASALNISTVIPNAQIHQSSDQDFHFHSQDNKDYMVKPFEENGGVGNGNGNGNGIDFMTGPPRFLFTIREETKEELESEDGKSRKGKSRSLNDFLKNVENNNTPYVTPISSPQFVTPPITPMGSCHSSQSGGYNPFFECSSDAEFNKIVKCSPPPKFKFLRDAEVKLQRKIMLMEEAKKEANLQRIAEENGSFIRIIVAKNNGNDTSNHHYHSPHCRTDDSSSSSSSSAQVLPLASSPSSNRKFKSFLMV
ncbi:hypothetical protein BVRB_2g037610 [Beta vulgaris subsp. vulgaris]|nr:hypothetical protein BVRB_2g037610 [Beta vulgaris subsp. vulgaris]